MPQKLAPLKRSKGKDRNRAKAKASMNKRSSQNLPVPTLALFIPFETCFLLKSFGPSSRL